MDDPIGCVRVVLEAARRLAAAAAAAAGDVLAVANGAGETLQRRRGSPPRSAARAGRRESAVEQPRPTSDVPLAATRARGARSGSAALRSVERAPSIEPRP
jgi:hypothetical protein